MEAELLKRLREGVYGELYDDEIINYPQATFDKVVNDIGESDVENEDALFSAFPSSDSVYSCHNRTLWQKIQKRKKH